MEKKRNAVFLVVLALCAATLGVSPPAPALTPPPECSDSIDNEGDEFIDFPEDGGCSSADDEDENTPDTPACDDGEDNDGDGQVDYPNDSDCADVYDNTEQGIYYDTPTHARGIKLRFRHLS